MAWMMQTLSFLGVVYSWPSGTLWCPVKVWESIHMGLCQNLDMDLYFRCFRDLKPSITKCDYCSFLFWWHLLMMSNAWHLLMMSVREVVTCFQIWVSDDTKTLYFPSWNYYKVYIKGVIFLWILDSTLSRCLWRRQVYMILLYLVPLCEYPLSLQQSAVQELSGTGVLRT